MAIKNIVLNVTGLVGVKPRVVYIDTDDTLATVTTAGYLNKAVQQGFSFQEDDMACVTTKTTPAATTVEVAWLEVSYSSPNWSLVPTGSPGEVVLPTVANRLAHFSNTTGTLSGDAADVTNLGDLTLGASGTEGLLNLYPSTAAKGSLIVKAEDNTGDTATTISNAAMGQASVISIPDPATATANFLLDEGSANVITKTQMVGIDHVLLYSAGTWTNTRIAAGNYGAVKSAADDTTIIGIEITPFIRGSANEDKGFRLNSFDVVFQNITEALDAHSVVLYATAYENNTAVDIDTPAITGTLPTAVQPNPYVTNISIDEPEFLDLNNVESFRYFVEITVNAAATSAYTFYGLNLHFDTTIS